MKKLSIGIIALAVSVVAIISIVVVGFGSQSRPKPKPSFAMTTSQVQKLLFGYSQLNNLANKKSSSVLLSRYEAGAALEDDAAGYHLSYEYLQATKHLPAYKPFYQHLTEWEAYREANGSDVILLYGITNSQNTDATVSKTSLRPSTEVFVYAWTRSNPRAPWRLVAEPYAEFSYLPQLPNAVVRSPHRSLSASYLRNMVTSESARLTDIAAGIVPNVSASVDSLAAFLGNVTKMQSSHTAKGETYVEYATVNRWLPPVVPVPRGYLVFVNGSAGAQTQTPLAKPGIDTTIYGVTIASGSVRTITDKMMGMAIVPLKDGKPSRARFIGIYVQSGYAGTSKYDSVPCLLGGEACLR